MLRIRHRIGSVAGKQDCLLLPALGLWPRPCRSSQALVQACVENHAWVNIMLVKIKRAIKEKLFSLGVCDLPYVEHPALSLLG